MKNIKKNYLYNLLYQILTLITPLITTPYVSRVLGAEAIGEYSYSYSIVYYFMLAAILGTATYAEREISFYQDDIIKRSARFCDLFFLRCITSSICKYYICCVRHSLAFSGDGGIWPNNIEKCNYKSYDSCTDIHFGS